MNQLDEFARALPFVVGLHSNQYRKQTNIPYISHLLAVAAMVIENGGDEETAIAALLHDAIEDQGGSRTREFIRELFSDRVVELIDSVSDTDQDPNPPWRERKEAYLAHLSQASKETLLIAVADKLHNARCTLADIKEVGAATWDKFNAPVDQQRWFYTTFIAKVRDAEDYPRRLVDELESVVKEMFS